jgi:hypothetical protein
MIASDDYSSLMLPLIKRTIFSLVLSMRHNAHFKALGCAFGCARKKHRSRRRFGPDQTGEL